MAPAIEQSGCDDSGGSTRSLKQYVEGGREAATVAGFGADDRG